MKVNKTILPHLALLCLLIITAVSCKKNIASSPNPAPLLSQSLPLGQYGANSETDPTCPTGYSCYGFEVQAPGVTKNERGFLAVASYRGTPRGLVMFFTGAGGDE